MKRIILLIVIAILGLQLNAQNYNILTNNGQTKIGCAGDFYDSGDGAGNYGANQNLSITFKSDQTFNNHVQVNFHTFDVDPSDTLYVYDGPTIASPLIGKYNNNNPLIGGQNIVQSTIINPTGELTFQFKSNATTQKSGWFASIVCIPACQKVIAAIDTLLTNPLPENNYIDICLGKPLNFAGTAFFPQNDTSYHQSTGACTYIWDFGDGTVDTGQFISHTYTQRRGYDIILNVIDSIGCRSTNAVGARVRISSFPTMHINALPEMCSHQTKLINVGYNMLSTVVVEPVAFTQISKQGFDSTMFIPDGPNCPPGTYSTPVFFNNFPPGMTLQSASDILSICVNIEHSFSGDLGFRIYCPNGQSVILDPNQHSGSNGLGNFYEPDGTPTCSAAANIQGQGWNYCWSEIYPNNGTLASKKGTGPPKIDSTNTIAHTNYYLPSNPLSGLVGCPLNGTWNIQITDDWGADNGYIFGWNLQLQANLMPTNWTYNVLLDSVGFSGPFLTSLSDTTASIYPTSGGLFNYNFSIVDDFGCAWDTLTTLKVTQMPNANLGNDTAVCYGNKVSLNAGNNGATYLWDTPSGSFTTQSLFTSDTIFLEQPNPLNYIVTITNSSSTSTITCVDVDTIVVTINPIPSISFMTSPYPAEGCEPLSVSFDNSTTPSIGNTYLWSFGDGATDTNMNPSHIYNAGIFDVTLDATTPEGCKKTHTIPQFIKSYPQPVAEFSWNPMIGVIQDPQITFTNLTTPVNTVFTYDWTFGTDGISTDKDPVHIFSGLGEYEIQLAVKSDKGCIDTVKHTVKIINDILEFPNIITPNGDGKNDFFVIKGLLDGGYPDTELAIYNRWGKKVYSRINYQNDFGGDDLADGVYFFIFKARGILREMEQKGSLQIMR